MSHRNVAQQSLPEVYGNSQEKEYVIFRNFPSASFPLLESGFYWGHTSDSVLRKGVEPGVSCWGAWGGSRAQSAGGGTGLLGAFPWVWVRNMQGELDPRRGKWNMHIFQGWHCKSKRNLQRTKSIFGLKKEKNILTDFKQLGGIKLLASRKQTHFSGRCPESVFNA